MKKFKLSDLDLYVGAACFVVLVLLIIVNVTLRYVFKTGMVWAEELILILFAWATYLGIVVSQRYNRHIKIDFIFKMFPKPVQKFLDIVTDIAITILTCYITYLAVTLCINAGTKKTLVMQLPINVVNSCLAVAFALICLGSVVRIVEKLKGTYVPVDPLSTDEEE
ncbi:MAG TPA: TRAP transporter small permease [Peptococcaceae bacterium]|nr:TRAP transporter small permease [Peptococcaceae bacterium]